MAYLTVTRSGTPWKSRGDLSRDVLTPDLDQVVWAAEQSGGKACGSRVVEVGAEVDAVGDSASPVVIQNVETVVDSAPEADSKTYTGDYRWLVLQIY